MKKIILTLAVAFFVTVVVANYAEEIITTMRSRLAAYTRSYKRVKLDVLFHQPKYAPGDTALFRTLYLTAADLKPVVGREIVYIEMFDQQGKKISRELFLVSDGWGSNSMVIPENLTPGIYSVVAYTDWMKNFDPSLFFQQSLVVTSSKWLRRKASEGSDVLLQAYPEGGAWVAGVENNVVFSVMGKNGRAEVIVKDGSVEVGRAPVDADGLAELKMTPKGQVRYRAELSGQPSVNVTLPECSPDGFAVQVSQPDVFHVTVRPSGSTNLTASSYFAVLSNKDGIIFSRKLDFDGTRPIEFTLPEGLVSGIAQLCLVDEHAKMWLQRTIYLPNKVEPRVSVKLLQKTYSTREGVTAEIEITDQLGNALHGKFATRVINPTVFADSTDGRRFADNILVGSDLTAPVRFHHTSDKDALARFLVTQSCPWLNWNKIFTAGAPRYTAKSNITISGRMMYSDSGKPVADSTRIMFFLQRQIVGYEIYTKGNGSFTFPVLFDFAGKDQVFYAASMKGRDVNNISVQLDKLDSNYALKASAWAPTALDDSYGFFSNQKKLIDKSFSFYSRDAEGKDSVFDRNTFIEDELQGADLTLTISDFNLFPTMQEVVREVLQAVDYRKVKGREIVRVYTTNKLPTNFAGPLFVIDGVLTKDPALFLGLKPADVITIKVIKTASKLIKFGSLGANGIILVRTKLIKKISDDHTFYLMGMLPKGKSLEIEPASLKNEQVPILRSCLYWNPLTTLDANGKAVVHFTTSDDAGSFQVHIEGITPEGVPFSADAPFQVAYNPHP